LKVGTSTSVPLSFLPSNNKLCAKEVGHGMNLYWEREFAGWNSS